MSESTRPLPSNDPLIVEALKTHPDWLRSKVLVRLAGHPDPDACWEWLGAKTQQYGRVALPAQIARHLSVLTHRVIWIALNGLIPDGLVLDHDGPNGCRNRSCANPNHLAAVTRRTNNLSGDSLAAVGARRTHCSHGHALVGANLRPSKAVRGERECVTCSRERNLARARLITRAHRMLGLSQREYHRRYGQSRAAAERVIEQITARTVA